VCCARIPTRELPALAALRAVEKVRAWVVDDAVWLRWPPETDVLSIVFPIRGVALFARRGEHWYRPGASLPTFAIPEGGDGVPLAQLIFPERLPPSRETTQVLVPARFTLVPDGTPRPTSAARCSVDALIPWANVATSQQLGGVRAAILDRTVV